MKIQDYIAFILLLPLPLLFRWLHARRKVWLESCQNLQMAFLPSKIRLFIPIAITVLIVLALTRPYSGTDTVSFSGKGFDIIVAFDVSASMTAKDVSPNRLEFARRKVFDLLDLIAKRSPATRVGIVLFSGEAYLFCPLTTDKDVLKGYVKSANSTLIGARGSSIYSAVSTALSSLSATGASHSSIILFTDGEDNELQNEEIRRVLFAAKTDLYIIGVGTEKGAALDIVDENGKRVISKLNTQSLSDLVEGVGSYVQARLGDSDIQSVLDSIFSGTSTTRELKAVVYREFGFIFLIAALIILLLSSAHPNAKQILPLLLILFSPSTAKSEAGRSGEKLYRKGDYQSAEESFKEESAHDPDNPKIFQGLGSSQFKKGDYESAINSFQKLTELTPNQFDAQYNLGNAYLAASKYKEAIESYDKALAIVQDEIRAKTNKEIAERRLEEEEKKPTPTPQQSPTNEEKKDDNQKQDQQEQQNRESQQNKEDESNSAEQTPHPSPAPQPTAQKEKESSEESKEQEQKHEEKSVAQKEAEQLLNSLPESPLLLKRKKAENGHPTTQTW